MKNIRFGNLLSAAKHEGINIIAHGCNAQGVMGSGVALDIRTEWPGAYDEYADMVAQHGAGNPDLLGKVCFYRIPNSNAIVANAITQLSFGRTPNMKYVSYEAVFKAFSQLSESLDLMDVPVMLHYPLIGAGLGGGDWAIISDIIESVLIKHPQIHHTLWIRE